MELDYGKVHLNVIDITQFTRTTVWTDDGADLIGVDVNLGVTATLASGGRPRMVSVTAVSPEVAGPLRGRDITAETLRSKPRGVPLSSPPSLPDPDMETATSGPADERTGPETDAELRAHLWLPRQRLILWAHERQSGNRIRWLESPRPGFQTDVANGPQPLAVDVVSVTGEPNSAVVHFQVRTRMSPCPAGSDRMVLAHRWQMSHEYDDNYYLTRTIQGTIVFNGAVIHSIAGREPDFIRSQFIHPIPLGFSRGVPEITASSDGLTIRYTITDTDPKICFSPGDSGATQIQIIEKMILGNDLTIPD